MFLDELRHKNSSSVLTDLIGKDPENAALREHLTVLFSDWVRSFHHPSSSEKSQIAHVNHVN